MVTGVYRWILDTGKPRFDIGGPFPQVVGGGREGEG
jgi:hypothetical protein